MFLKVNMISSVVIFCAASTPVIVQNQCTHSYLTEASNVLHASKDDYSEIVMYYRHEIVLRANVCDSGTFLEGEQSKTTDKEARFVQKYLCSNMLQRLISLTSSSCIH